MNKDEIKAFISEKVATGMDLSAIQNALASEKGLRMTFMELRLIASEIESADWSKGDSKKSSAPKDLSAAAPQNPLDEGMEEDGFDDGEEAIDAAAPGEGAPSTGTVVELSRLARPGTVANGSVKFASGASAEWFLDQYGRIGLDKASGKPTADDLKSFQLELQKLLSSGM